MLTNKTISGWADELWDGLNYDMKDSVYTLRDGREIKLEIMPDEYYSLLEDDFYGAVELDRSDPYTGYSRRPDGFDGAARKFDGNGRSNDTFWWQPPTDLVNDKENCAKVFEIVRGYYNQDWWYVGVAISIKGDRRSEDRDASLWGIESNAGEEYFKEIIRDLLKEAYAT